MSTGSQLSEQGQPGTTAMGRSAGFERGLTALVGFVVFLAGLGTLLIGSGLVGAFRARRPLLDPMVVRWLRENPRVSIPIAIIAGIALFLLGLWWLTRSLRPELKPDLRLEGDSTGTLTVTESALAHVVRVDAEAIAGVVRARARLSGSRGRPHLRLVLSLREGTDVRAVRGQLDHRVLSRARRALETETLPTAVRLELHRAPGQRVG